MAEATRTPLAQISSLYSRQSDYKEKARQLSVEQRIALLRDLGKKIENSHAAIKEALYHDFRKNTFETDYTEIYVVESTIRHVCRNLKRWAKNRKVKNNLMYITTRSYLQYEPKGNSLIITPWNYPFQIPLMQTISSIAAGNTVMLKLSEYVPHTNAIIEQIISSVFEQEHVAVTNGQAEETTHLLNLKFDHIHFTGSPQIGKLVMQAASKHLSDITLELGGKSPVFINQDVNLRLVVRNLIWGKFVNAGQTCIAPDYALIDNKVKDTFEKIVQEELSMAFGSSTDQSPDLARIINDRQFDRLERALKQALEAGARVLAGGETNKTSRFISPTILTDIPADSSLMTEEIFGPILPVIYYDTLSEALSLVSQKEKPLALYIFSRDHHYTDTILRNTTAGSTAVNDMLIQYMHPHLPFGGVNHSGIGQSFGQYGFKSFSHERTVVSGSRSLPISQVFWYPYTAKTEKLFKFIKRFL
ncbi:MULTISPECIES: aldehyde dehydrogenase family protein [Sphingobacterium]|uniref:aldehyde dehydrogenase family protein n=1 Tax=Sphingobacterium TaxID=28453 RepID=UPI0019196310|nr:MULTISPECIES: aldehyde dehydrogenase family protein [Sphingobacterium]QQT27710.1 aldehyde dehydrogenase family protein [Sphingobacterium spiritivorum]